MLDVISFVIFIICSDKYVLQYFSNVDLKIFSFYIEK